MQDVKEYVDSFGGAWGPLMVARLEHITKVARELETKQAALDLARDYLRQNTRNVRQYTEICQELADLDLPVKEDKQWIDDTRQENMRLSERIQGGDSSVVKISPGESIYGAQAEFYTSIGDYDSAIRKYGFQMTDGERWERLVKQFEIMYVKGDLGGIRSLVNRLSKSANAPDSCRVSLAIFRGVVELRAKEWGKAAGALLDLPDDGFDLNIATGVSRLEDVATYVGLCALASFSRQNLQFLLHKDPIFVSFTRGSHFVLQLIEAFLNLRMDEFSRLMNEHEWELRRDLYLHPTLTSLLRDIRDRAKIEYLRVHSKVSLGKMATTFGIAKTDLIKDLISFVDTKSLNLKFDTEQEIAYLSPPDTAADLLSKARILVDAFERDAYARLWVVEAYNGDKADSAGKASRKRQRRHPKSSAQ
jgi:COP9 signalosome complex subunit 1